jgi:hypothetical protein
MFARSYEEAIGFMLGNVVMDKDGVSSECHTSDVAMLMRPRATPSRGTAAAVFAHLWFTRR